MKRFATLLLILLLLLPVTLHADTAWIPPDPYLAQHPDSAYRYTMSHQDYVALCSGYLYTSPEDPTPCGFYRRSQSLHIEYYCYNNIYTYGLVMDENQTGIGWIPIDAVQPAYGSKDYLNDHWDLVHAYVGELDDLLPSQAEREAIEQYREQYTGGDSPADWMAFDFPYCTQWAYPNAPISYGSIWLPDIHPVHTLIDDNGTVWVYAHTRRLYDLGYTYSPFWICVSDPDARPDPNASATLPPLKDPPTHLPVPGQLAMEKVSSMNILKPIIPVLLTVFAVMLFSAVLIVLLQRKKVT